MAAVREMMKAELKRKIREGQAATEVGAQAATEVRALSGRPRFFREFPSCAKMRVRSAFVLP